MSKKADKQQYVEQQVAIAYADKAILSEELKNIYGEGKYKVTIKCGFFHLQVPERLTQAQIDRINDKIRAHYQTQYEEH